MNIIKFINNAISNPETKWECDGERQNYQLTNYQCFYSPDFHSVTVEEVCINQYGSMFGIGLYAFIKLPKEIPAPDWLGGWTLLSADGTSDADQPTSEIKSVYTFVEHPEQGLFAIDSDKLQQMNLANVYTEYGQMWGHNDAGDYIEILSEKCADFIDKKLEGYLIGDPISAYDNSELFDGILESDDLEEGIDYNLIQTQVTGFTYWDGHNWRSIVMDCAEYPSQWEIVSELGMSYLIDNMEKVEETAYGTDYRCGFAKFSTSNFQGRGWYEYKIELGGYLNEEED